MLLGTCIVYIISMTQPLSDRYCCSTSTNRGTTGVIYRIIKRRRQMRAFGALHLEGGDWYLAPDGSDQTRLARTCTPTAHTPLDL